MKKFVMMFALVAIIATGTAFADHPGGLGIGVVVFYPGGGGLSLKIPSIPIYWSINAGAGADGNTSHFSINLTGDYYLIDKALVSDIGLHWFLGLGGFGSFYNYTYNVKDHDISGSYTRIAAGARIPLGLSWQPISLLEIFLDIAPSLGVNIDSGSTYKYGGKEYEMNKGGVGFGFYWPIELGIRLWF
jgi:hypothetical protein